MPTIYSYTVYSYILASAKTEQQEMPRITSRFMHTFPWEETL